MSATTRGLLVTAGIVVAVLYFVASFAAGAMLYAVLSPPDRCNCEAADVLNSFDIVFFGFVGVVVGAIIALVVTIWIRKSRFLT